MNTANLEVFSLMIFALTSFQLCSCVPGKTQRSEPRDENSQSLLQRWLTEPSLEQADKRMDVPQTKVLQKRIFMGEDKGDSRYNGFDPVKSGHESTPDRSIRERKKQFGERFEALNKFKNDVPYARQAQILQKRIFMGEDRGRDVPDSRYTSKVFVGKGPQKDDPESIPQESNLEKLLSLRARARALHMDIDNYIEEYRKEDAGQDNSKKGDRLHDAKWENIPQRFRA